MPTKEHKEGFAVSVSRRVLQGGAWQWQAQTHALPKHISDQLFWPDGRWRPKDKSKSGTHTVLPLTIEGHRRLWVKVYPEQPATECLVQQLDQRLGVNGTPSGELVKFHHGQQTSPAWVSCAVVGPSLREVLTKEPELLGKIDFASFAKTLLRVLLTNPEDDKDDDYFLVKQRHGDLYDLVRIDNERAFYAPLIDKEKSTLLVQSKTTLQVKSIIYLLEQMRWNWYRQSAAKAVLDHFVSTQPIPLIAELLAEAQQQHAAWQALFSLEEVVQHFRRKLPEQGLSVFFMPPGLVRELITRLMALQTVIRMSQIQGTFFDWPAFVGNHTPKLAWYYIKDHYSVTPAIKDKDSKEKREERRERSKKRQSCRKNKNRSSCHFQRS